jgi:transcriptional regulator with XRE-family HTH domain
MAVRSGPESAAPRVDAHPAAAGASADPVVELGARLKSVRLRAGLSLREVARQLGVSPSFVSQLENGKSQPSVATLYSISQLLGVSIDQLFLAEDPEAENGRTTPPGSESAGPQHATSPPQPVSRSALGSPGDAWQHPKASARLSVTRPGERRRLEMDTGVVWEQLATNTGSGMDFIEITYPPHSTSTSDNRMLQHSGWEFGYLVEGELEITVGFEIVVLRAGDALGFDSSMPHLLSNHTGVPARGIWYMRHPSSES